VRDALVLVLGLGNRFRRDDAVGLVLADALRVGKLRGARVETAEDGGPLLWERWAPKDRVLLLDAAEDGETPGTLRVYDLMGSPPAVERARASSHGLGLVEAVALARALGRMPRSLALLTVTGADFLMGEGLSADVRRAVPAAEAAVTAVLMEARDFRSSGRSPRPAPKRASSSRT
jgi:hydrogenase maturation protease